ncbi:MAG: glycerophosphodiester phosphodiesterase [Actinobacteria bacterium]|nr:glycerophosphodiester phosphodiesterase [Actinomycetota bacterium]
MPERTIPLVFAHRGVSAEFPENTVAAFAAAAGRGADGVELDVRRTADGALVVHHDAHLADGRAIVEMHHDELPGHLPGLEEALVACGAIGVNIEIKNYPGEPDHDPDCRVSTGVVDLVQRLGIADRVIVSSFNYADIAAIRHLDGTIATGWLVISTDNVDELVAHLVRDGHRALHPPESCTDDAVVAAAHAAGLLVNVWTVDDPGRIVELAAMGVDTVITNDPDGARRALEGRLTGA